MATSTVHGAHCYVVRDLRPQQRVGARGRYGGEGAGRSSVAGVLGGPWLARLERALARDMFALHFQPIVGLDGGGVRRCEALVRLEDGNPGELVAPGSFLPVAERYGLVARIDRLVLSRVVAWIGAGAFGADTRVAVNLSAVSIGEPSMLDHIERELRSGRVAPERLIIEVTETAAICDMGRASAFCAAVEELGCAVALDDFGSGFGSLHYLKRLAFSYLKIDGEFIRSLPASREDRLVVQALVGVARGMGKRTIAECVGDRETVDLLRELGVDFGQGFHLGRPRPLEALAASG